MDMISTVCVAGGCEIGLVLDGAMDSNLGVDVGPALDAGSGCGSEPDSDLGVDVKPALDDDSACSGSAEPVRLELTEVLGAG